MKNKVSLCGLALLLLGGDAWHQSVQSANKTAFNDILDKKTLVVVTRRAPTIYDHGLDGPDGYEYRLTQLLGEALNVKVEYRVYDSTEEVLRAIRDGEGHLAAASLVPTDERQRDLRFGPHYKTIQQWLVCSDDLPALPRAVADLSGLRIDTPAATTYADKLAELQQQNPYIRGRVLEDINTEQLLKRVDTGELDCAIADSHIVEANRRYYPRVQVAMTLEERQPLAWALPKEADELAAVLEHWFARLKNTQTLAQLDRLLTNNDDDLNEQETATFAQHIDKVLPRYQKHFETAAQDVALPWTLLAAVAYQESHWQPHARGAGGEGMMMLSRAAAGEVKVKNRLDPQQNIKGGGRYLAQILQTLPEQVQGRDRYWMALVAYNIGPGHLHDAFKLARHLGKDPYTWHNVKTILPLLSKKQFRRYLKHGYARGGASVQYAERIIDYQDIIEKRVKTSRS